ncbi:MAG: Flp family type IVb pilin [Alphaproteobacteria bacterium]|nr:Flp family type IVb pilin [Alphaproteobacteria bacterium]
MRSLAQACHGRLVAIAARRDGASAIEYALLASLIAVVIVGAVTAVGVNLGTNFYNRIASALT